MFLRTILVSFGIVLSTNTNIQNTNNYYYVYGWISSIQVHRSNNNKYCYNNQPMICTSKSSSSVLFLAKITTTNSSTPTKSQNQQQSKRRAFAQAIHAPKIEQQQQQRKNEKSYTVIGNDDSQLSNQQLQRRNVKNNNRPFNTDSSVGSLHKERIATAGRVGTKRFVDPCKVYIGNLPFTVTDDILRDYVCTIVGLPAATTINQCKIVYDWQTRRSKGYGFVVMTEPIYATVFMDKCENNATIGSIDGRRLTVRQGKSKKVEQQLLYEEQQYLVRQQKRQMRNAEDDIIQEAIKMTPEEIKMLKRLDPDLAEGVEIVTDDIIKDKTKKNNKVDIVQAVETTAKDVDDSNVLDDDDEDFDDADDEDEEDDDEEYDWEAIDTSEEYDDSDSGVDGIWYEDDDIIEFIYDTDNNENDDNAPTAKNRAQRRNETSTDKKRKKLSYKGFG